MVTHTCTHCTPLPGIIPVQMRYRLINFASFFSQLFFLQISAYLAKNFYAHVSNLNPDSDQLCILISRMPIVQNITEVFICDFE